MEAGHRRDLTVIGPIFEEELVSRNKGQSLWGFFIFLADYSLGISIFEFNLNFVISISHENCMSGNNHISIRLNFCLNCHLRKSWRYGWNFYEFGRKKTMTGCKNSIMGIKILFCYPDWIQNPSFVYQDIESQLSKIWSRVLDFLVYFSTLEAILGSVPCKIVYYI